MIRVKKENHRSWFMSNYYPCEFVMNGIRYKNAEAAFQSHKVPLEERRQFADMPPASAKRFGRNVAIPANWDEARDDVMRRVVMAKFEQNEDLKYSEIAYPSEDIAAKEEVFTALSDEVNSELDVKWSEMKSYDEGGSGYLFLMLLAAMLALACFNIWRKVRRKTRNMY